MKDNGSEALSAFECAVFELTRSAYVRNDSRIKQGTTVAERTDSAVKRAVTALRDKLGIGGSTRGNHRATITSGTVMDSLAAPLFWGERSGKFVSLLDDLINDYENEETGEEVGDAATGYVALLSLRNTIALLNDLTLRSPRLELL